MRERLIDIITMPDGPVHHVSIDDLASFECIRIKTGESRLDV